MERETDSRNCANGSWFRKFARRLLEVIAESPTAGYVIGEYHPPTIQPRERT